MKYIILLVVSLCIFSVECLAQNIQIKGEIFSNENKPVAYANISLQTSDSVFVTGVSSDEEGRFSFTKLEKNNYIFQVSSVGYKSYTASLDGLITNLDLGEILLEKQEMILAEVSVTAANIIDHPNRKIVFPNRQQVQSSTNGLNLLQNIMLPGVKVNPLMNSISLLNDGEIQLRINGVQVSEKEVIALAPADIIQIEYIDNPGLRYGNAEAVLNYKTRKYTTGGAVSLDLMNSPHVLFGEDQISTRFNVNKSEFKFNYSLGTRDFYEYWRSNEETFNFENEPQLKRTEVGQPGRYTSQIHNMSFTYNYQEPNKYFFNVNLNYIANIEPHSDFKSKLFNSYDNGYEVMLKDFKDTKSHFPSLDIYYLRELKNKQRVMFNVVGTYIGTDLEGIYEESSNEVISKITRGIDGNKYSIIGEGLYEKDLENGKLSVGFKHTQSFSDNTYSGSDNYKTDLDKTDTYCYAEYTRRAHKFEYTLGMGVNRSWLKQNNEKGYETYNFRPRLVLNYKFSDSFSARFTGKMDNYSPNLSELSDVEQAIDLLQIERGNPDLSPYKQYQSDLYFEYHKGLFTGIAKSQYINANNPIMESTLREEDKFVHTYDNQKEWVKFNNEFTARVGMLWKVLQFSLTGGMNRYISEGNKYLHTYNNWYYSAEMLLAYKKWIVLFNANNNWNNFWGESLIGGENMHMMMLMHNHNNCSIGMGVINPFADNYKRTNKNRNQYASYQRETYLNETSQLFLLKFAWNFNFGKNYSRENKRLHNDDSDSGIMNINR